MKYKCPGCNVVADIDVEKKSVHIFLPRGARIFPQVGHVCELAKAVDKIDLSKLERVE